MDKNYTVVETSKIAAVRGGGHLHTLIADVDVENGHICYVGDLAADVEGVETHEYEAPTTALINKRKVVLVANPEWSYDECRKSNQALFNYINEAGRPFRAYDLFAEDQYAVSAGAFDVTDESEIVAGKYVIAQNGKDTLKIVDEAGIANQGFYAQITGVTLQRGLGFTTKNGTTYGLPYKMYLLRVIRNDIV